MFIQNEVVQAGVEFSNTFPFHKSAHREKYADIDDPLFKNGQVHYSKWCSVGHQVRTSLKHLLSSSQGDISNHAGW